MCNVKFGVEFTIDALKAQNFDACFVAVGCSHSAKLRLENDHAPGILDSGVFLDSVARAEGVNVGNHVIVVGGGMAAVDSARTALRLGAKKVEVLYRRSVNEMSAPAERVRAAQDEGVEFRFLTNINTILVEDGEMVGIECVKTRLGEERDMNDCRRAHRIEGSDFTLEPSLLITAVGNNVGEEFFRLTKLPRGDDGTINCDPETGVIDNFMFAGGDCVMGPTYVANCISSARKVSLMIDAKVRGLMYPSTKARYCHTMGKSLGDVNPDHYKNYPKIPRIHDHAPMRYRIGLKTLVEPSWSVDDAVRESGRCMQCGCTDAESCKLRDVTSHLKMNQPVLKVTRGLVDLSNPFFKLDMSKCIGCEVCIKVCEQIRGASVITQEDLEVIPIGGSLPNPIFYSKCESCGACVDVCPVNARSMKRKDHIAAKESVVICPYCGCGCSELVGTYNGRIVSVRGNPDSPANHGQLCLKGRFGLDYTNSHQRLTHPLLKKDGVFVEASWDEALDFVAEKLLEIKTAHGPDSIMGFASAKCTNEDNYVFQKFMRGVIGTNNVDHCARLCHASTVSGLAQSVGSGAMTNPSDDLLLSKCIVIIGSNTSEAHPIISLRIKQAASRPDVRIFVIDPREIEVCQYAEKHLRQRPGTDVALLNSMMHVIVTEGLMDFDFVSMRTEGWDETWEVVQKFTPEVAEEITGVPAGDIRAVARAYATADTASLVWAMGITQSSHGTDNVLALANLAMLTGQIGRAGAGLFPLRGQNNVQGCCDMGGLPEFFTGYQRIDNEQAREKMANEWKIPVENLSTTVGGHSTRMVEKMHDSTMKAAYFMGENPAMSDPNITHFLEALDKCELVVCQDIFLTETARHAHVVFPSSSLLEKTGSITNTERRVQLTTAACDLPGASHQDYAIVCDVATRMGYEMYYPSSEEICAEIARVTPSYGGNLHSRLKEQTLQWPCPDANHQGTPILHMKEFTRGRGKFYPTDFREAIELPDTEYPYLFSTGRILHHFHTGTMTCKSAGLVDFVPRPFVEMNAHDAAELAVEENDYVRVTTRRGTVVALVKVQRVPEKNIFMPFHFHQAPANLLTNDALDPVCSIPELKVCAARVERYDATMDQSTTGIDMPQYHPINLDDVTLVINAGGKSVRMGTDKALVEYEGKPLVKHVLDNLSFLKNKLIISNHPEDLAQFGVDVVADAIHDVGPLGGLYTALGDVKTSYVVFVACDMPNVTEEFVHSLLLVASQSCVDAVVPVLDEIPQPLCAFYCKECRPFVKDQIDTETFQISAFLNRVESYRWIVPDRSRNVFKNVNTPQDLK
jgi:formate dehydrogenase alpha subunit